MLGTTLNQRFTLDKELGRGGMGAVYRATDLLLDRTVAIKVLKERAGDDLSRRIRLEAQILARLLHDNIVRLYDFGESDGIYYLIMEEVDGTSYARRWRQLPLSERLRVLAEVADALDYAHHQGVIHRDVKPANILLTASDKAKLSDFGLSQLGEKLAESGTVRGTPHYMSPEQARGKRLDHRSDLYSLGVVLYECAAGGPPFLGPPLAIMAQHVREAPEPPRARNAEITPTLEAMILRLMAKDPNDRYATGKLLGEALRDEMARQQREPLFESGGGTEFDSTPSAATVKAAYLVDAPAAPPVPADAPTVSAPFPAVAPSTASVVPSATAFSTASLRQALPLVREMLEAILAEPIALSPDERYLGGHYLAYLLGGARRRGPLLRRKVDPRNSDRARLLLGLTAALVTGGSASRGGVEPDDNVAVARAVELLEMRHEVRPLLNPMVVMKYLACRDTPAKRKRLRQVRKQIQDASPYAQRYMTDANGALNPGLIPQTLDDLRQIAPDRTEMDDQLVARWNRLGDVWRGNPDFREAVLRYATRSAATHPASAELWPEVVYPLIARARWQRRHRPRAEVLQDALFNRLLRIPNPGLSFDRAFNVAVPAPVGAQLDVSLDALVDSAELEADLKVPEGTGDAAREFDFGFDGDSDGETNGVTERESSLSIGNGISLHDLATDYIPEKSKPKRLTHLASPDPIRFLQGELFDLWQEAVAALQTPEARASHRYVPIGPYRLAVIPSVRSRSAGHIAIQGMVDKQIEILTPSFRSGGSIQRQRPILATWIYRDNSLVLVHLDFRSVERYVLWHAPSARQTNYDTAATLNHNLYMHGLEVPDQLDRVLSKRFLPRNVV